MSLNNTPAANRLHIGIFGKRNSGKSSLVNAITNQSNSLVSSIAGTTTDPVYKAMELRGIGPCVFIDTAGFDDVGNLGALRVERTINAMNKIDIAILVFADNDFALEKNWYNRFKERGIKTIAVVSKSDIPLEGRPLKQQIFGEFALTAIEVSTINRSGIDALLEALVRILPADYGAKSITAHLVKESDIVMLVMPQDSEAPKGRLILPQVQTIRDLLDNRCIIVSTTPEKMQVALDGLKQPPSLIITDSQVFKSVFALKPKSSRLTSFSVLFAALKGDLPTFIKGAKTIDSLNENSRILIAEACTHAPLSEDIGRVKIPAMLRKKYGKNMVIDIVSGSDFPNDLSSYDLIVHCGGCMFNRNHVLSRVERAKVAGVPITNYGVLIAELTGILDVIEQ